MAALSGLRERQETMRPTSRSSLECSGFATQNNSATCSVAMLRSCSSCCCGVATCGAAVLQVATLWRCNYQQHCNAQHCGAAHVAAALRRYTSCCDAVATRGVTSCGVAACVAATLRRGSRSPCYKLRRCSSWGAVTLWRCSSSWKAAPVPLPGCAIRVWREGVVTELIEFLRCVLLILDAFALATERSSLSDCLAAAASEVSELLPKPANAEERSNL
ncbi:unnamed protein product [Sphagnum jensenii]|uniref:Uncharacterized protein n=1 Tax=Sphagnum jensenii TaxID=128206 RepID=A0ABP1BSH5_9BRYO